MNLSRRVVPINQPSQDVTNATRNSPYPNLSKIQKILTFCLFVFCFYLQEDSRDCGGVSGLSPSLWSMVGIQLILLWLLSGSRHCQLWPYLNQNLHNQSRSCQNLSLLTISCGNGGLSAQSAGEWQCPLIDDLFGEDSEGTHRDCMLVCQICRCVWMLHQLNHWNWILCVLLYWGNVSFLWFWRL